MKISRHSDSHLSILSVADLGFDKGDFLMHTKMGDMPRLRREGGIIIMAIFFLGNTTRVDTMTCEALYNSIIMGGNSPLITPYTGGAIQVWGLMASKVPPSGIDGDSR